MVLANAVMLIILVLSVIMQNVIILIVAAPMKQLIYGVFFDGYGITSKSEFPLEVLNCR